MMFTSYCFERMRLDPPPEKRSATQIEHRLAELGFRPSGRDPPPSHVEDRSRPNMNTTRISPCSYSSLGQPLEAPVGLDIRADPTVVYM
jgi:hypothetical protein